MKKNQIPWRKFALLICIFISYLSPPAQAQTGSVCDSALNLYPVEPGGPFTLTTWAAGTNAYYIHFYAMADSMGFVVDTALTNNAEVTTAELYSSTNCPLSTPIATHNYSTSGLIFSKTGLTVGGSYYIKISKGSCNSNPCNGQAHQLNVSLQMSFRFCMYLSNSSSNPANTGVFLLETSPSGDAVYYESPDFSVSTACATLCFTPCDIPSDLAQSGALPSSLTYHPFTITGPSGYSQNQTTVIANGGCFTLSSPGVYTYTDLNSGVVINITVSGTTTPPLSISTIPNSCTLSGLSITSYINNLAYYPGSIIYIDGDEISTVSQLCPGSHTVLVEGYDLCGNYSSASKTFTILPITGSITSSGICAIRTLNAVISCASAVTNYHWYFGDGTDITTSSTSTSHLYATAGTYSVNLFVNPNYPPSCDDDIEIDQNITVPPPTGAFTLTGGCFLTATVNPTYTCSSLITSVLWNFGDGTTSTSLTPGSHTYSTAGTYTVTLTYTYINNNLGTITTVTQTVTHSVTVTATTAPTITAPENTCSDGVIVISGATVTGYSIISGSATIASAGPGAYSVSGYGPGNLVIQFNYTVSGCTGSSTVTIEECCQPVPTPSSTVFITYANTTTALTDYLGTSMWPGTLSGATTVSGATIYVYDDLVLNLGTISTPFNFVNCTFNVYPGKKLTVWTGHAVTFRGCTLQNMCNEMWDGVYIPDNATKVNSIDTKYIQAINAIVSTNGGLFNITGSTANSQFYNCWKGIVINGAPSGLNHLGTVIGTKFYSTTGALLPPHAGAITYEGIEINGSSAVSVGHITLGASTSSGTKLEFDNMNYGIRSIYYNVDNTNSYFTNIIHVPGPFPTNDCETGTAICIRGSSHATETANIGGIGTYDPDNFNTCYNGINTVNYVHLYATNNQISNMNNIGIFCNTNNGRTIQIKGNTFNFYRIGIDCYNNNAANITITSNSLNTSTGPLGTVAVGNTGILMEEAVPQPSNVTINLNTIKYNNTGIWLRNASGTHYINSNQIRVLNTTPSSSNIMYGIRMENTNGASVLDNTVYKSLHPSDSYAYPAPAPTSATYQYLFGITAELSANCRITSNHIYKIGRSIYFLNNCSGSYFLCNDLHQCYTGLYFANASIPSQYSYGSTIGSDQGTVFDNMVIGSTAWRFEGVVTGSVATVYRQPSAMYTNTPSNTLGVLYSNPSVGATCTALPPPDTTEIRQALLGSTVNGTNEYSTDSTEFVYWDKQQAYKFLNENPEFITLGAPDDENYQDFVSNEQNTEIGLSNKVYDLVSADLIDSAQVVNNSRSGESEMDQNSIIVSNIYLKSLNGDTLTVEDSTTLNNIAWLDPFKAGEAVYMARVILDIDPTQMVNENKAMTLQMFSQPEQRPVIDLKVYPNPGTETVTVEIEQSTDNEWQMVVIDETGKEVLSRIPQQINQLDVKNWSEGLYLILIRKDGQKLNEQKLIIQH